MVCKAVENPVTQRNQHFAATNPPERNRFLTQIKNFSEILWGEMFFQKALRNLQIYGFPLAAAPLVAVLWPGRGGLQAGPAAAADRGCGRGRPECSALECRVLARCHRLTLRVCHKKFEVMSTKPKLYYFNGRGKMESIRWLLAAAGVEFEEEFLETRDQYEKLLQGGSLLFQQVPMVEIDGMRMVQTRAILSYIAAKYNLYGKDLKERALIDMYVGGTDDLMGFILMFPFLSAEDKEKQHALIVQKATSRYFPVYEKVLKDHGQDFLVGNNFSWADIHLLEAILMVEEKKSDVLSGFPQLQAFKARISSIPAIKKFLEPGSQRKPVPDDKYVETVRRVLRMYYDVKAN